ncbi:MAG: Acetylornithine aminotransferase [Firmicutes bacterium ADurb.Bin193]|nr:MAG: Acetylornithine aminotransferase [Firmicutes bacterium ADurb.Bin193]
MELNNIISLDKKHYMNTFGDRTPVCFERGEGLYLYATDGKRYADFMGGIAVNALGHSNPVIRKALHDQIDKVLHTSNLYYIENQALLAEKLTKISCADRVFFANSGAEANEGALKLARIYFYKKGEGHKNEVITLKNSFHGRTLATVAATGQEKYQKPYAPLPGPFVHVEPNDIDALYGAVTENICAIMLEVIQGESGVHPLTYAYLSVARKICDEKGILLIFDEVQTGMGRTGEMFGYEHYCIEPDIFTLAKALGGGVPIGAVCAKDFCCAFNPGDHGTTFGGNPLACRAALAVLEVFERDELVENSRKMGEYLVSKIDGLKSNKITQIRGRGLMIGIELNTPVKEINKKLFDKGYLCGSVGNTTLRILPPLTITKADIDGFVSVLKEVLS